MSISCNNVQSLDIELILVKPNVIKCCITTSTYPELKIISSRTTCNSLVELREKRGAAAWTFESSTRFTIP